MNNLSNFDVYRCNILVRDNLRWRNKIMQIIEGVLFKVMGKTKLVVITRSYFMF